jgi:hypothetical protein
MLQQPSNASKIPWGIGGIVIMVTRKSWINYLVRTTAYSRNISTTHLSDEFRIFVW